MKNNHKEEIRQNLPPYVSFKTFLNLIAKLKETTITARIDRSSLQDYSGGVAGALITTLKYLKLIDDNTNKLPALQNLVEAYGTENWKDVFVEIIDNAYTNVVDGLDITTATRAMLEEKFRQTGAEGEVLSKCINFYLNAYQEADIPLSPVLKQKQRGRREQQRKKPPKSPRKPKDEPDDSEIGVGGKWQFFNIPILGDKPPVKIYIPRGITKEEWEVVNSTITGHITLSNKERK